MRGVIVYDHTDNRGNTSLILADSALMKMSKNKDYLIFTMYDGVSYMETNIQRYRDTTYEVQHVDFYRQELIIPLKNYSFEKSDSSRFGDQANSMKWVQLAAEQDTLRKSTKEEQDKQYNGIRQSGY